MTYNATTPNNWRAVREHYNRVGPLILAEQSCEWAIDPYAWDETGAIHLTPIEAWLWSDIRQANAVFYPQWPVAGFFVDFANPVAKVAIECDGYHYHLDRAKDRTRDEALAQLGWAVYRIPGAICMTEQDEETGQLSRAALFIRDIVNRHPVSRNWKRELRNQSFGVIHA